MNYKINNTSVCLDKFTSLVVSFFFEKRLNTLYTGQGRSYYVPVGGGVEQKFPNDEKKFRIVNDH